MSDRGVIAVIPARGGSKRIPRKNIKSFGGNPIISYSIRAAIGANLFDGVYVSTEDAEIGEVSVAYGAEVIDRPIELADDYTPTIPVVRHSINWLVEQGKEVRKVCCIYPTAPFVQPDEIQAGYDILCSDSWNFVITATEYSYPIQRSLKISDKGEVAMVDVGQYDSRTQDLSPTYHDADKFYWGTSESWKSADKIFDEYATAVIVPRSTAHVIDTEEDWKIAEQVYQIQQVRNSTHQYLSTIDQIENIRKNNNVNWMDILRLAFRSAPHEAATIMKNIYTEDSKISELVETLTESSE